MCFELFKRFRFLRFQTIIIDARLLDAIEVTGTDAFPILDSVLQHASVFANIGDCSHLITGFTGNIAYPALLGIDTLHNIGTDIFYF